MRRRRRGKAGRYVVRTGVVGGKAGIFVFVVGWLERGGDGDEGAECGGDCGG